MLLDQVQGHLSCLFIFSEFSESFSLNKVWFNATHPFFNLSSKTCSWTKKSWTLKKPFPVISVTHFGKQNGDWIQLKGRLSRSQLAANFSPNVANHTHIFGCWRSKKTDRLQLAAIPESFVVVSLQSVCGFRIKKERGKDHIVGEK